MGRSGTFVSLAIALMVLAPRTDAQTRRANNSLHLPVLGVDLDDPGDDREWRFTTQIDPQTVSVSATAPGGVLAVVMRRVRHAHPTCADHAGALFRTHEIEPFRTLQPVVFRGLPWEPQAFRQHTDTYDAEFGCLRVGEEIWFAGAIAQPRAAVSLADVVTLAARMARALVATNTRHEYPVSLEAAGLDLDDPGGDAAWLFLGRSPDLPVPSEALSSHAGEPGGVTITVGRRVGTCPAAWQALRAGLRSEGSLVDRPGYVPEAFGPRIRRIVVDDHLREVYCAGTTAGAVLVTAVFRNDDGDAMTRLAPMLRSIAHAAQSGPLSEASSPPPTH